MRMFGSFGFSFIRSGFVSVNHGSRENTRRGCIDLLPEKEWISFTHQFSLTCYFSPSLCVTHTHPHTHAQTAVIVGSGGILEGSSFCVLITAGGIAYAVADSQLQAPQCRPEPGFLFFLCPWGFPAVYYSFLWSHKNALAMLNCPKVWIRVWMFAQWSTSILSRVYYHLTPSVSGIG